MTQAEETKGEQREGVRGGWGREGWGSGRAHRGTESAGDAG